MTQTPSITNQTGPQGNWDDLFKQLSEVEELLQEQRKSFSKRRGTKVKRWLFPIAAGLSFWSAVAHFTFIPIIGDLFIPIGALVALAYMWRWKKAKDMRNEIEDKISDTGYFLGNKIDELVETRKKIAPSEDILEKMKKDGQNPAKIKAVQHKLDAIEKLIRGDSMKPYAKSLENLFSARFWGDHRDRI